jgi:hypothetical protein
MQQSFLDSGRAVAALLVLVVIYAVTAILARESLSPLLPVADASHSVSDVASAGSTRWPSRPLFVQSDVVVPASVQMANPAK